MPSFTCSRSASVAAVFTLTRLVHVASVHHKARDTLVGFPIVFDNLPTNVQPSFSLNVLHGQTGTPERLMRYEVPEHAGIGDRVSVIATLIAIATEFKATLAFPSPMEALGAKHGNASASWWDAYIVTTPAFVPVEEVDCSPGAIEFNITSTEDFDSLLRSQDGPLNDEDTPVCIRLQEHFFALRHSEHFMGLAVKGGLAVSAWTSNKVALLSEQVKAELMQTAEHYNAMHIRLGDKATTTCESAVHVTDTANNMILEYAEYAEEPWFLMSDGDEGFFADMYDEMERGNLTLIAETDLETVKAVTDNYMRFSALECVFAAADLALITYKDIGHRCLPGVTHAVQPRFIDCKD